MDSLACFWQELATCQQEAEPSVDLGKCLRSTSKCKPMMHSQKFNNLAWCMTCCDAIVQLTKSVVSLGKQNAWQQATWQICNSCRPKLGHLHRLVDCRIVIVASAHDWKEDPTSVHHVPLALFGHRHGNLLHVFCPRVSQLSDGVKIRAGEIKRHGF